MQSRLEDTEFLYFLEEAAGDEGEKKKIEVSKKALASSVLCKEPALFFGVCAVVPSCFWLVSSVSELLRM